MMLWVKPMNQIAQKSLFLEELHDIRIILVHEFQNF